MRWLSCFLILLHVELDNKRFLLWLLLGKFFDHIFLVSYFFHTTVQSYLNWSLNLNDNCAHYHAHFLLLLHMELDNKLSFLVTFRRTFRPYFPIFPYFVLLVLRTLQFYPDWSEMLSHNCAEYHVSCCCSMLNSKMTVFVVVNYF